MKQYVSIEYIKEKLKKLSKNDKFETNKIKMCFFYYSYIFLNDSFYFSCYPFGNPPE